jgi:hypothetical protein
MLANVYVWLVALARTKLIKETEPEENPLGFSEYTQNKKLSIHVLCAELIDVFLYTQD